MHVNGSEFREPKAFRVALRLSYQLIRFPTRILRSLSTKRINVFPPACGGQDEEDYAGDE
jgi:hypothetical protein